MFTEGALEEATSINRIVLPGEETEAPAVPDSFREMLRKYDPDLFVTWNTARKRFVIEQCVRHLSGRPEHTHLCQRNYVVIVQDDEGCMVSLGEKVIQMIAERDNARKGFGPGDLERFLAERRNERDSLLEKVHAKGSDSIRHATRDGRRQLLKAAHLIQQHSLEVNQ